MFRSGLELGELRTLVESVVGPEDLVLIGMVYFMKCEVVGKVVLLMGAQDPQAGRGAPLR